jgi:hypothetical protein
MAAVLPASLLQLRSMFPGLRLVAPFSQSLLSRVTSTSLLGNSGASKPGSRMLAKASSTLSSVASLSGSIFCSALATLDISSCLKCMAKLTQKIDWPDEAQVQTNSCTTHR